MQEPSAEAPLVTMTLVQASAAGRASNSRQAATKFALKAEATPERPAAVLHWDMGDDEAEIIATCGDGLYAKDMGGGSVNPVTGEFNFAVSEGYLIKPAEDG